MFFSVMAIIVNIFTKVNSKVIYFVKLEKSLGEVGEYELY